MPKPIPQLTEKQKKRFWSKVDVGEPDECWLWLGASNDRGQGYIEIYDGRYRASRVAWVLAGRPDLGALLACHSCDNPPCVNPNHLWAGTDMDNIRDSIAKGRNQHGGRHWSAKLTPETVVEARRLHALGGTTAGLARSYGVTPRAMRVMLLGKTWAHVTGGEAG